jgi:hypothetical protein
VSDSVAIAVAVTASPAAIVRRRASSVPRKSATPSRRYAADAGGPMRDGAAAAV